MSESENETAAQAASNRQYDWRPRPDPTVLTTQQLRDTEASLIRTISERVAGLRELIEQRLDGMDTATVLLADRIDKFGPALADGRTQLRHEFTAADHNLRELIEARLVALDEATRLLASNVDKSPTDIEKAIIQLKDLLGARIDGMDIATRLLAETVDKVPSDVDRSVRGLREILQGEIRQVEAVTQEKFSAVDGTFASNALALTAALAAQKEAASLSVTERILCADLTWRPAGDLRPGDELIAFDEKSPDMSGRRYRRAIVTTNILEPEALLRVNTPMGSVRCTYNHPWLVRRHRGHAWEWRRADELRPGDMAVKPLDVWEVDRSWQAGWLAGILDGEGCLGFKSHRSGAGKLSIGQVDGVTADMIDEALTETGAAVLRHTRPAQGYSSGGFTGHAQAQRRWEVNRRADIMRILGTVRPRRLMINADQVWEGFPIKSTAPGGSRLVPVESVEPAGTGMVAHLGTSTRTYIGAGFAMHNSEQNKSNTLAITKSEQATKETIAANAAQTATGQSSLSRELADLKERLVRLEAGGLAAAGQRVEAREEATYTRTGILGNEAGVRANISAIIAAIALIVAVVSVIVLATKH